MLEEFLSQNEGKTLEFKENTANLKGIVKSIIDLDRLDMSKDLL